MSENISNKLNVLFSSNDNYAQHLGVAIYSLLKTNTEFEKISIYIVENNISVINKEKLNEIILKFENAESFFIDFEMWKEKLDLKMQWNISISSYARLFIADMLSEDIEKVLYLDSDVLVCSSLKKLWEIGFEGKIIGAVQDTVSDVTKAAVGLTAKEAYANAGVLLIDLKKWREKKVGEQCLKFINDHGGSVTHHDQGVLNGVLHNQWLRVPLEYNVMTIHYMFSLNKVKKYFKDKALYYSEEEVLEAKRKPVILHFTPSFTSRPWVKGCKHPYRESYWDILENTPWRGSLCQKDNEKWYVQLINWRYRNLPF